MWLQAWRTRFQNAFILFALITVSFFSFAFYSTDSQCFISMNVCMLVQFDCKSSITPACKVCRVVNYSYMPSAGTCRNNAITQWSWTTRKQILTSQYRCDSCHKGISESIYTVSSMADTVSNYTKQTTCTTTTDIILLYWPPGEPQSASPLSFILQWLQNWTLCETGVFTHMLHWNKMG